MPDATPTPPSTGIYGMPLKQYGDEFRENLQDGGYIRWQIDKRKDGTPTWMPSDYVEAPKGKLI